MVILLRPSQPDLQLTWLPVTELTDILSPKNKKGRDNHVIVMHIDASPQVHANQADDVFLRIGDKSKLQTFEERLQLNYDKKSTEFLSVCKDSFYTL